MRREVYVPLVHRPGEAQVDFGHALVKENGALRKVVFFMMVTYFTMYSYNFCWAVRTLRVKGEDDRWQA